MAAFNGQILNYGADLDDQTRCGIFSGENAGNAPEWGKYTLIVDYTEEDDDGYGYLCQQMFISRESNKIYLRNLDRYKPDPAYWTEWMRVDSIDDYSITEEKLAPGAVTNANILDGTITKNQLAGDAVTSAELANNAVTSEKMVDGAVTENKLSTDLKTKINSSAIADGSVTEAKLDSTLKNKINTPNVADGSITTNKLADYGVTINKIAQGAINNHRIQNNAVDTRTLADGAVTEAKMDTALKNKINIPNILDKSITTNKLADYSVTNDKIAQGAINNNRIQNGAVSEAKLDSGLKEKINSAVDVYATTPKKIGIWSDGTPIWRVTFQKDAVELYTPSNSRAYLCIKDSILQDYIKINENVTLVNVQGYINTEGKRSLVNCLGGKLTGDTDGVEIVFENIDNSNQDWSNSICWGYIDFATNESNLK